MMTLAALCAIVALVAVHVLDGATGAILIGAVLAWRLGVWGVLRLLTGVWLMIRALG